MLIYVTIIDVSCSLCYSEYFLISVKVKPFYRDNSHSFLNYCIHSSALLLMCIDITLDTKQFHLFLFDSRIKSLLKLVNACDLRLAIDMFNSSLIF